MFDVKVCVSDYTQAEIVCNLSKQLYRQLESIHWLLVGDKVGLQGGNEAKVEIRHGLSTLTLKIITVQSVLSSVVYL